MALIDDLAGYWECQLAENASIADSVGDNDLTITDTDGVFDNAAVTPLPGGVRGTALGTSGNTIAKASPAGISGSASGLTVNIWLHIPALDIGQADGMPFHRHGGPFRLRYINAGSMFRADVSDGVTGVEATNGGAVTTGTHMVTVRFVPLSVLEIYVDAVLYASIDASSQAHHAGSTATLGLLSRTGSDVVKMSAAEAAIWNRALSSAEIAQLYGSGSNPLLYRSGAFRVLSDIVSTPRQAARPFWM
jgi:Concanavalin A-like lectin/glucanases superfamily